MRLQLGRRPASRVDNLRAWYLRFFGQLGELHLQAGDFFL